MLTSVVVVNSNLHQHSIVLNLRLTQRRAVVGSDDQLSRNKQTYKLFYKNKPRLKFKQFINYNRAKLKASR